MAKLPSTHRYVALLRGINVGGNRLIKMDALSKALSSAGLKNVRTFIASGNVVFDSSQTDLDGLARKIERKLLSTFGHEIAVVVLTVDALGAMAKGKPFRRFEKKNDVMLCAVFFVAEPPKLKLPIRSRTDNLDVIAVRDRVAYVVCRRKKNGWFGFPNNFVEKQFGVAATTRQWRTVERIVAFASAN